MDATFLFTDLVGFTALTAERGDDHAADVALRYQDVVRALLPAYGAEEIKPLGDGLMLRAGHPCHAVRLGLRIVDAVEDDPLLPPVRVGMHTGPAVQRAGDWFGATVNVASRLCSAAAGGQVLVSEATADAAGAINGVVLRDRRLHWLRNVPEPFPALVADVQREPLLGRASRRLSLFPTPTPTT